MKITIENANIDCVNEIIEVKEKLNAMFNTDFAVTLKGKGDGGVKFIFEDN